MGMVNKFVQIFLSAFESFTGYLGVMQSDHAYIHAGLAYTSIINTGSISSVYYIGFTTPTVASGKYVHWRPTGITTSADYVDVKLYEGDSFSSGTANTPINRNRISTSTTSMQAVAKGVTSTPSGTIIQQFGIGTSGGPASRSGGGVGANEELVLKQNTSYVLAITPDGATVVNASLFWYEEGTGV